MSLNGNAYNNTAYLNTANSGDVLTQAAGHTISGYGQINASLDQSGAGQRQRQRPDAFPADEPNDHNAATMEATNGGVLNISTTVNNAGGTILADGGNVQFNGSAVVGGTLTSTGTSNLSVIGSDNILSGVTLSNGSRSTSPPTARS